MPPPRTTAERRNSWHSPGRGYPRIPLPREPSPVETVISTHVYIALVILAIVSCDSRLWVASISEGDACKWDSCNEDSEQKRKNLGHIVSSTALGYQVASFPDSIPIPSGMEWRLGAQKSSRTFIAMHALQLCIDRRHYGCYANWLSKK